MTTYYDNKKTTMDVIRIPRAVCSQKIVRVWPKNKLNPSKSFPYLTQCSHRNLGQYFTKSGLEPKISTDFWFEYLIMKVGHSLGLKSWHKNSNELKIYNNSAFDGDYKPDFHLKMDFINMVWKKSTCTWLYCKKRKDSHRDGLGLRAEIGRRPGWGPPLLC